MQQKILNGNISALLTRVFLAIVIFPHGAQKMLGWFGGYGFQGTMQFFTQTVGLPWIIGFMVILIEFFGPLFLVAGFATRINGFIMSILLTGIIFTSESHYFFMNWFGNQKGEGFEYFLLAIGLSLSLLFSGAGAYSLDHFLGKQEGTGKILSSRSRKRMSPAI